MLREGQLDDKEIELDMAAHPAAMEIFAPPGMEELTSQLQGMFQNLGQKRSQKRKLRIAEAMKQLADEEAGRMVNEEEIKHAALRNVEANGIVFLDEIDKIAAQEATARRLPPGVQRDLLPLVEGATVTTKFGMVKTDHILFIASGAFHLSKPSDLIPELQGRFPIRVELPPVRGRLRAHPHRHRRLSDRQYQALMETEGVKLSSATTPSAAWPRSPGGQRAHREHRRPPPAHGDGTPAGRHCPSTPTSVAAKA
jgi:ATP-dependent HslUV protease ATP-binding subunit HslU